MRSVSLSIFGIKIKRLHQREGELLDQFTDQGDDFFDVLKALLGTCQGEEQKSEESSQALQVVKLESHGRQLEGLLEAGSFGTESRIKRLGKFKETQYTKTTDDVDLHPFYFLFDIPVGRECGFLLLQSSGSESIQTLFRRVLHDLFVKQFANHKIHYHPMVPEELKEKLDGEGARGTEIRFVRHRAPADVASLLGRSGGDTSSGSIEMVMKFHEDGFLRKAFEKAMQKRDGVIQLEDMTFPFDSVKIKMKLGAKERLVDLGNPGRLRPTMDITEDLKWRSGNPTFTSLSEAAQSLLSDMKKRLEGGAVVS